MTRADLMNQETTIRLNEQFLNELENVNYFGSSADYTEQEIAEIRELWFNNMPKNEYDDQDEYDQDANNALEETLREINER